MDEKQREQIALFRFSVINDLVGGVRLERGELERLIRDKSQRRWFIPGSNRTRISAGTIRRWIRIYEESGHKLESLYPVRPTPGKRVPPLCELHIRFLTADKSRQKIGPAKKGLTRKGRLNTMPCEME